MKTYPLIVAALFLAITSYSQPVTPQSQLSPQAVMVQASQQQPPPRPQMGPPPGVVPPAKDTVNYLIRVDWNEAKGDPKSLEVLTAEGQFQLDTIQKASVKINNTDIPVTLKFTGTIHEMNEDKGKLQLFLGRSVPYVTSSTGNGPDAHSTYSQLSVGLDSAFIVTFGKPVVIQSDENGQISVLVKRIEN